MSRDTMLVSILLFSKYPLCNLMNFLQKSPTVLTIVPESLILHKTSLVLPCSSNLTETFHLKERVTYKSNELITTSVVEVKNI